MFDLLERTGLVSHGAVNRRAIASLPFSRLIDLADTISTSLNSPETHRVASPYLHSSSLGLGGAGAECQHVRCRLQKISTLARFAGLYSDGVFVHNFFADYASVAGHPPECDSERFRGRVADDVAVVLSVRPLVEGGLIRLFSPAAFQDRYHVCIDCLAKQLFGARGHRRFRKAFAKLSDEYLNSVSVEVYSEDSSHVISCSLPERLFEHGGITFFDSSTNELAKLPRVLARIDRGEHVDLPKDLRRRIGIHRRLALYPIQNVSYHAAATAAVGTSFLTDRQLDIDLLHSVAGDQLTQQHNAVLAEHLQLILPMAGDVSIKSLLKLRQREEEAFFRFQAAMHRMVAEIRSQRHRLTDHDARMLYGDVIRPRLAELDQKVREAKRDLLRHPSAYLAGTVAVLGLGFFSGALAAELQALVGFLGASKTVHNVAVKTIELSDVKKAVRQDDMYYLWRARNLSRRAR